MKLVISIDDTDNIESIGTGDIAQMISKEIEKNNFGKCSNVTRHQLFVHDDIPYTSHNSSMCFEVKTEKKFHEKIISLSIKTLKEKSAPGSDPGLCVVNINSLKNKDKLINLGKKAKKEILTKKESYNFAHDNNIHLSEHGGTGQGIIGALAGAGLRLSGNDGRFKGKHKIKGNNGKITVKELCNYDAIDEVRTREGYKLNSDEVIKLGKKIKTVYLDYKAILPVYNSAIDDKTSWETCTRQQLRNY